MHNLLKNGKFRLCVTTAIIAILGFLAFSWGSLQAKVEATHSGYGINVPDSQTSPQGLANYDTGRKTISYVDIDHQLDKPSIKSALKGLHHAVSSKLDAWKPWRFSHDAPENTTSLSHSLSSGKAKINSDPGSSEETISSTGDQLGHLSKVGKCTISLYGSSMYERALHTHKKQCVALSHNFKVAVAHTRL